jgi:protein-tyrosine phosphatase
MRPDWIDLEGTANARDVGGLPATGGQRTVSRRLLRSDSLQDLTPADVRRLVDDYGVRAIADLRSTIEVMATGPGPMTREPLVSIAHLSLFPEADDHVVPPWERRSPAGRGFAGLYLGFLADRPESVLAALRLVAHTDAATIVHCTGGKDRTGVVVALALADAGVERAAIVADYAASADHYDALLSRLAGVGGDREPSAAAALKHVPRPVTMERFLDGLAEESGGAGPWLDAHGWTNADRAALRHKLLDDLPRSRQRRWNSSGRHRVLTPVGALVSPGL